MAETYWSAKQGGYIKCPVGGCNHIGIVITNAHCRLEHGMTRKEVQEKYGLPQNVSRLNKRQMKKIIAKKGEVK